MERAKNIQFTHCAEEKGEVIKEFEKGDLIHVFGYFKENKKGDKVYRLYS